jgi:hypothetical protein
VRPQRRCSAESRPRGQLQWRWDDAAAVLLLLAIWHASWLAARIASSGKGKGKGHRIVPTVGHC